VKSAYDKAGGDDAEQNKIAVKEIPDAVEDLGATESKGKAKAKDVVEEKKVEEKAPQAPTPVAPPKATPKEKIRHDWYQSAQSVTIDLLAAGVPKDQVEANFEPRTVSGHAYHSLHGLANILSSLRSVFPSSTLATHSTLHYHHFTVPSIRRSLHIVSPLARLKSHFRKPMVVNGLILNGPPARTLLSQKHRRSTQKQNRQQFPKRYSSPMQQQRRRLHQHIQRPHVMDQRIGTSLAMMTRRKTPIQMIFSKSCSRARTLIQRKQ